MSTRICHNCAHLPIDCGDCPHRPTTWQDNLMLAISIIASCYVLYLFVVLFIKWANS